MRQKSIKDFSSLKDVISQVIKDLGLSENLIAWQAVLRWKEIVGEKISKYARATEVKEGILYVSCPNPTWRAQLILMKQEIVNKANQVIGQKVIKDIKFIGLR